MPRPTTEQRDREWHLLGAGAIGTLFAHRLADADCHVQLLSRGPGPGAQCLALEADGATTRRTFEASAIADPAPIGQLLVTTKAADVDPALAAIRHRLLPDSRVIVLANGMGFGGSLPHNLILHRGTTTEGAFRRNNGLTVHAGRGSTRVGLPGSVADPPPWFAASWGRLTDCTWDSDIEATLWRKLAVNCVINPLTAVFRCRNGELAHARRLRVLQTLCAEVTAACRAAGHGEAVASLFDDVMQVIQRTATNRSSMLQDVLRQRPTEIDYINGFLLRQPDVARLPMPLNRRLVAAVTDARRLDDNLR